MSKKKTNTEGILQNTTEKFKKTKSARLLSEFKSFIISGNFGEVVTGLVIATALTTLIRSLINEIVMPFVTLWIGNEDVSAFKIVLREPTASIDGLYVNIGVFVQNVADFLVLALIFFILLKIFSKFNSKNKEEKEAKEEKSEEHALLLEINKRLEHLEKENALLKRRYRPKKFTNSSKEK